MHGEAVRDRLESLLSREVHDDLWAYLSDRGFVEDARLADDIGLLADEVRRIWRAGAPSKRTEPLFVSAGSEPSQDGERAWLLSRLVAKRAQTDTMVVGFRTRYLPDGLVAWSSFDEWLRKRLAAQGPITEDIAAPLPPGTEIVRESGLDRLVPPLEELRGFGTSVRTLDYALPDDTWVRRVVVSVGSILDQLRELSQSLASSFAWRPAQASVFVVCGVTPFIASVRTSVSRIKTRDSYDLPWARRIKLDIDPAATSDQVLQAFRDARSKMDLPSRRTASSKPS